MRGIIRRMNYIEKAEKLSHDQVAKVLAENDVLSAKVASIESQLAWFKRQFFGQKSERYTDYDPNVHQHDLFSDELKKELEPAQPVQKTEVAPHTRTKKRLPDTPDGSGLRFSADVPLQTIYVPCPLLEQHPHEYEQIGEEITYRLAQRPAAYEVLKYIRKVIKKVETREIISTPAPNNVFERSQFDVSFIVGIMVDKFEFHLPLYRQHLRIGKAGVLVSRNTLSNLVYKAAELLRPIYLALLSSVLLSKVLAMDETTVKAGAVRLEK